MNGSGRRLRNQNQITEMYAVRTYRAPSPKKLNYRMGPLPAATTVKIPIKLKQTKIFINDFLFLILYTAVDFGNPNICLTNSIKVDN